MLVNCKLFPFWTRSKEKFDPCRRLNEAGTMIEELDPKAKHFVQWGTHKRTWQDKKKQLRQTTQHCAMHPIRVPA